MLLNDEKFGSLFPRNIWLDFDISFRRNSISSQADLSNNAFPILNSGSNRGFAAFRPAANAAKAFISSDSGINLGYFSVDG